MNVWEFMYCDCIHESAHATMSIHRTKKGAEKAMKAHIKQERKEWKELWTTDRDRKRYTFGKYENWAINKTVLQD